MTSDSFLDGFMMSNDEVKKRVLSLGHFGEQLDNEANDVPLYDQYNRGLAVTQESRPRINLAIDPQEQRCGLTGYIPSAEEGLMMGASPMPRALVMELGDPEEEELVLSQKRKGLSR
jgi:hypothetical protein